MSPTELLESLSETGARIIAEDDTHAVIAIRVDKTMLQKLLQLDGHFIAALWNLAPKPGKEPKGDSRSGLLP